MSCDERFEYRLTSTERTTIFQFAAAKGLSVSAVIRIAVRAFMKQPGPVDEIESIEVTSLRRRINALAHRVDELGRTDEEADRVRADLRQAHHDAQRLLGR